MYGNYSMFRNGAIPVASIEEAKNAPIDLSGNLVCYFNQAKNEVYLRQFNANTGGAFFFFFVFAETPKEEHKKDEISKINEKLDYLYGMLDEIIKKEPKAKENKKAVKDDE